MAAPTPSPATYRPAGVPPILGNLPRFPALSSTNGGRFLADPNSHREPSPVFLLRNPMFSQKPRHNSFGMMPTPFPQQLRHQQQGPPNVYTAAAQRKDVNNFSLHKSVPSVPYGNPAPHNAELLKRGVFLPPATAHGYGLNPQLSRGVSSESTTIHSSSYEDEDRSPDSLPQSPPLTMPRPSLQIRGLAATSKDGLSTSDGFPQKAQATDVPYLSRTARGRRQSSTSDEPRREESKSGYNEDQKNSSHVKAASETDLKEDETTLGNSTEFLAWNSTSSTSQYHDCKNRLSARSNRSSFPADDWAAFYSVGTGGQTLKKHTSTGSLPSSSDIRDATESQTSSRRKDSTNTLCTAQLRLLLNASGGFAMLDRCVILDPSGTLGAWTGFIWKERRPTVGWSVSRISHDPSGFLWSLNGNGELARLTRRGWRSVGVVGNRDLADIAFDSCKRLWGLSRQGDIAVWNGYTWDDREVSRFKKGGALCFDRLGCLWVLNTNYEVAKWDTDLKEWDVKVLPPGLKPKTITFDAFNNLWAATGDGQLGQVSGTQWIHLGLVSGWRAADISFRWQ